MKILGLTVAYDHTETADAFQDARIEREAQAMFKREIRKAAVEIRAAEIKAANENRMVQVRERLAEIKAQAEAKPDETSPAEIRRAMTK